eukprot:1154925-Pelagomonas_calceolata.AAC.15
MEPSWKFDDSLRAAAIRRCVGAARLHTTTASAEACNSYAEQVVQCLFFWKSRCTSSLQRAIERRAACTSFLLQPS